MGFPRPGVRLQTIDRLSQYQFKKVRFDRVREASDKLANLARRAHRNE